MDTQTGTVKNPEILAKVVWRAATARHTRVDYTKNAGFLLKVYDLIPIRLQVFAPRILLK